MAEKRSPLEHEVIIAVSLLYALIMGAVLGFHYLAPAEGEPELVQEQPHD